MQDRGIRANVLVVEDDPDCGQMMVRILTSAGYGVRWTPTPEIAVEALKRYLYNYIILDLRMPGMPTEEFLAHIRSASHVMNIILTTAETDAKREAARLGVESYLGKPFAPEDLVMVMRGLSSGVHKIPPRPE